ncbi:MAG TPA: tetratricopeptide repeat protein [Nitrospira sp.]|nr:tetratricopeptide repeat protein [Nitrospira sp.]
MAFGLLALLLTMAIATAGAEEVEFREYDFGLSKGLLLYSNQRYAEAERYLSEAYRVKPGDTVAGYYLGQSLLRLRRYADAEARYREILLQHPTDARARMGLGMALYHQERHAEALANLSIAEQTIKDDPLLYYYAGLAAARRQSYEQATEKFLRAGSLDPELAKDARYQRGAALASQGKAEQAAAEFRAAVETPAAAEAEPTKPSLWFGGASPSKRWNANFAVSAQYDSNVVLLPSGVSSPGAGISHKSDFVSVLTGNGEYRFFQNDTWTAGAGYGFYQNLHARLSEFNVQDHTPTLYVQRRFGLAQLRFQYILDYVTVGGDPYLLSNALQPTLTYPESDRTFTQVFARYQYKDFKSFRDDQFAVPINQTRDGVNWMFGGLQYIMFPDNRGHVRVGYTFDADRTGGGDVTQATPGRPTNADWSYTGHRLSTGIAYQPMTATTVQLAFDYYRQNYSNANSFSFTGTTVRHDNVYLFTLTGVRELRSWLWLAFQWSYTRDQSNIAAFDYTRNIISLTLGGAF